MKRLLLLFFMVLLNTTFSFAQDRDKAEQAVRNFMSKKETNYKPDNFGECFEQYYPDEIALKIVTNDTVKFSLVHTYYIGKKYIKNEYFHLNKDYKVIGHLSFEQMMKLTINLYSHLLDSLRVNIDTSNVNIINK
ncbi:MAG: hypothetical protein WCH34_05640 [Bacteroidota bacterium]